MKRMIVLLSVSLSITLLFTTTSTTRAQGTEICNNGIDDDGDNRIDCYDTQCINDAACEGFYLGNDALCTVKPSAFPQFTMTLDFASENETTNHIGRMVIGDLDADGTPEIITMNRYSRRLIILNGNDGSTKLSVASEDGDGDSFEPLWEVAIGNIDNDNCAEIFFQGRNYGDELWLYAFDCNLNLIWDERIRVAGGGGDAVDAIMFGLADFDADGKTELYLKDMILDAHTGTIIVNTATTSDNQWNNVNGGPVAVDITGNANLELVSGCKIYGVDLGTRAAGAGSISLLKSVPDYYIRNPYNATSVADYNLDGYLDVVASGSTNDGSPGNPKNTTIFFWDVEHDTIATYMEAIAGDFTIDACPPATGSYYTYGWRYGTGRVNIADLDGDGRMNVSYVSGKFLYALDHNLELLWRITVNEETSGYTGCTLFDFNGDGKYEIVYRDERYLYIIDGTDGSIYSQQACISRTNREYPIVADVDADGSTELCVTCGFDDQLSADNFCDLGYARNSHVRVFKSASEPWVPARRVWNQHGYFNVNVNEDLTIPRVQQKHHLVWSTGTCTTGPNRPLNGFLNQAPFLNSLGCPIYASPNLAHVENSLEVFEPTCPQTNFTVSFRIKNIGDVGLTGNVPVTFYNGDPTQPGAVKLNTVTVALNDLDTNEEFAIANATVNGPGSPFTLYIVLNDAGTSVSTPITLPNTNFIECEYDDNIISEDILPNPVDIAAVKVKDNIKCPGSTSPDNGAVRAFVPAAAGAENTIDYNFYWSDGTVAKPIASVDFTGAVYTGVASDTFTVYAIHKTAGCSSDTTNVVVGAQTKTVSVSILQVHAHDMCTTPPNGIIKAVVNGGEPPDNYTYEWFEGASLVSGIVISIDDSASNLAGSKSLPGAPYTVRAIDTESGCSGVQTYYLLDQTIQPVANTDSVNALCAVPNSGSVSANVGGAVTGFRFDWYNGLSVKPTPDHTGTGSGGANYNNRPPGNYTVVATNTTTQCKSQPVTVSVGSRPAPVITAGTLNNQTSCDPALPLGSVTASVTSPSSTYAFEWFRGQNTLLVNRIDSVASVTTRTLTQLPANIYTVKVTDINTGCAATAEATVITSTTNPLIAVGGTTMYTNCISPNGSVTVNVSLNGSPDNPANYEFFWYDGAVVKNAPPDYPASINSNVLDGRSPGQYTVRARHRITRCYTPPTTGEVIEDIPSIQIIVDPDVTDPPDDCDANGTLKINISAAGNTSGFRVEWFRGKFPFTGPALFPAKTGITSDSVNIPAGSYSVFVTNLDNGCDQYEELDFPALLAHKLFEDFKTDAIRCVPDTASFGVKLRPAKDSLTNTPYPLDNYEFHLYAGTNDLALPLNSAPGGQLLQVHDGVAGDSLYAYNNLTPGFYTVVAISDNDGDRGCRSVPVTVEIEKSANDPVIVPATIPNRNCAGAPGGDNGEIQLAVSGDGGSIPADYDFKWFSGPDVLSPEMTGYNSATASGLSAGTYTVQVTNQNVATASTGCFSVATFSVADSLPILSAEVPVTNISSCDLSDNNSTATVSVVRENGNINAGATYTIEWFTAAMGSLGNGISLNNQPEGTYYVQVTNDVSNCKTLPIEFEFQDSTMGSINIDLASFTLPTRCFKDNIAPPPSDDNLLGELMVNPIGNSTTGYTYEWYSGNSVGPIADTLSNRQTLSGITIPVILADTTFTVKVTNNSNDCYITDTYTLSLDVKTVILTASATPLTFCNFDNGSVFSTVSSGGRSEYNYNWYFGTTVDGTPDSVQNRMNALPIGDYTIVAVDPVDPFCQSAPVKVHVGDGRIYPVPAAMTEAPLTNCDTTKPNAVASAEVDGDFVSYTFDWYEGASDTGTPVYTGVQAGGLTSGVHTIRATHNVTACAGTTQLTIGEEFIPVQPVQITVLSHHTSCAEDNGALSASVGGNTQDYIFDWYTGSAVKAAADHTGEFLYNVPAGIYTVTATSRITGCTSSPVSAEILKSPVYPDFAFGVINASCSIYEQGTDGQPDGVVSLIMKNDVDIKKITWDTDLTTDANGDLDLKNDEDVTGPVLSNVEAGTYSGTVTTALGCHITKEVEVKTEIHPFNGISRDGDGRNELFYINCIDNFPDNIVRIYNRAGTLVYEGHGYDNIDVYFDGVSNKGITVIGNNLPDGTYFYVIDKRDGSKPVGGYLEIVN